MRAQLPYGSSESPEIVNATATQRDRDTVTFNIARSADLRVWSRPSLLSQYLRWTDAYRDHAPALCVDQNP